MILLANVACQPPKIQNKTKEWTQHDQDIVKQAENHCKVFYGQDYCIRVIIKTGDNAYRVICYDPKDDK